MKNNLSGTNTKMWNSELCKRTFSSAASWREKKTMRIKVFDYTLEAIRNRKYLLIVDGNTQQIALSLSDAAAGSLFFDHTHRPKAINEIPSDKKMVIEVVNSDCIDAAEELLIATGIPPLVLNMASATHAGGGVENGAGAQEENLCRRTDYVRFLFRYTPLADSYGFLGIDRDSRYSYPLDRWDGAVYSEGMTVFRGNEADGYPFLEEPFRLDFVAVAALNLRRKEEYEWIKDKDGNYLLSENEKEITCHKIRLMLRIAAQTGHRTMVLSAFGCGAFSNPAREMATMFHQVLSEKEFCSAFDKIVFAILEDHNSCSHINPEGNYKPFKSRFGEGVIRI